MTCLLSSEQQAPELFEAMLAGLGHCGIITRVKLSLAPAQPLVRSYLITSLAPAPFFRDIRTLMNRGEVDEVFNLWLPYATTIAYQLNVRKYFDSSQPPNDGHIYFVVSAWSPSRQ